MHSASVWLVKVCAVVYQASCPVFEQDSEMRVPGAKLHRRFYVRVGGGEGRDDCMRTSKRIQGLMDRFGISRHPSKGVWGEGVQVSDHLGFTWGSGRMRFTVAGKQERVWGHAVDLLQEMERGRRWVGRNSLQIFAMVAVALTLAMSLTSFYSRAIFESLSDFRWANAGTARGGTRVRLRNRAVKGLRVWAKLREAGLVFMEKEPKLALHTDAANMGGLQR